MSRVKIIALLLSLPITALPVFAAGELGVTKSAETLFKVGPLVVTNSMVTSWIVAFALIVIVRLVVGRPQLIPSRGQAVIENLLGGIRDLTTPIVGKKVALYSFPLLITLFTYILIQNWSSLVPGVGTIHVKDRAGEWVPFIRPANADLNGTIALALVADALLSGLPNDLWKFLVFAAKLAVAGVLVLIAAVTKT